MTLASHAHETPALFERAHDRHGGPALVFDRSAAQAVDRAATEEFGIPGIVLMENAARALLQQAMTMLESRDAPRRCAMIFCGPGNNGGDGYALARHLHNRGVGVTLVPLGEPRESSDAALNRAICGRMGLPVATLDHAAEALRRGDVDLIVDAIFGTGLDRAVEGIPSAAIDLINESSVPVLAVDVPSGMDCNTGEPLGRCVRAACTVTFIGLKTGFMVLSAQKLLGEVVIGDIGEPRELLQRYGKPMRMPRLDAPERAGAPEVRAAPGRDDRVTR